MGNSDFSIVIPVFNAERSLNELSERIKKTLSGITENYEVLLIDDYSRDSSWELLKKLRDSDERIKIIHLAKNSGQHNAILCGLKYSKGKKIIIMDDDLQNPPEEISKLIDKSNQGYRVVYGKYLEKRQGALQKACGFFYHYLLHRILDTPNEIYFSNFVIMTSDVKDNLLAIKSSYSFLTALIAKTTPSDRIANVDVIHNDREFGESNYGMLKHFKLFTNLIINQSSIPLQVMGIIGGFVSVLSLLYGSYLMINKLINPSFGLEGWNSLMVTLTLLGGLILMSVAFIGEYLRRILVELTFSQPYIVDEMEL